MKHIAPAPPTNPPPLLLEAREEFGQLEQAAIERSTYPFTGWTARHTSWLTVQRRS